MDSIVRKLKIALTKIMYPIGILIANMPHTIHYGLVQFNPKRQVWSLRYKQDYPNCVWFDRYPKVLNITFIGMNSYSANAIQAPSSTEIYIGNKVRIASGLKIIDRVSAYNQKQPKISKLHIGNNVFIGTDSKIMVAGGRH